MEIDSSNLSITTMVYILESDNLEIFIKSIKCLKKMFNIDKIVPYLNKKWQMDNNIFMHDEKFFKIRELLKEL